MDLLLQKAKDIEKAVFDEIGGVTQPYPTKMRSLFVNLKDKNNPSLREAVGSGDIPVAKFVKMTSQDMASEERKKADEAIKQQNLHNALGAEEQQAETSAFQCPKCKQVSTVYIMRRPLFKDNIRSVNAAIARRRPEVLMSR